MGADRAGGCQQLIELLERRTKDPPTGAVLTRLPRRIGSQRLNNGQLVEVVVEPEHHRSRVPRSERLALPGESDSTRAGSAVAPRGSSWARANGRRGDA
jgi:hypothetical protein